MFKNCSIHDKSINLVNINSEHPLIAISVFFKTETVGPCLVQKLKQGGGGGEGERKMPPPAATFSSYAYDLSKMLLEFFFKSLYYTILLQKFQIHCDKIIGKHICELKNWLCSFLVMSPSKTIHQVLLITTTGWRKYPFPPNKVFEKYIFPNRNGEGSRSWKICQN